MVGGEVKEDRTLLSWSISACDNVWVELYRLVYTCSCSSISWVVKEATLTALDLTSLPWATTV